MKAPTAVDCEGKRGWPSDTIIVSAGKVGLQMEAPQVEASVEITGAQLKIYRLR